MFVIIYHFLGYPLIIIVLVRVYNDAMRNLDECGLLSTEQYLYNDNNISRLHYMHYAAPKFASRFLDRFLM